MTFGNNVKQMITHVYGDIEITSEELKALKNILAVDDKNKLARLKMINKLFKNVAFQLLKELDKLEREHGGKLRKQQPTGLNLTDNVRMDSDDVITLYKDNLLIGINNLKLKKLIDKMKESI
jgi:hypothetical protein